MTMFPIRVDSKHIIIVLSQIFLTKFLNDLIGFFFRTFSLFPTDDDIESNPNIIEEWNEMIPGVEDTEVQLCALYLMITELAGIFPMEPGTVELYANKFSGAFQAVKTKYNSGNSPATITQVYF